MFKPYPSYKASGVSWIGEVPEHWEVRRLKRLCSRSALYGANVTATSYTATGVRFLRTTDITEDGYLKSEGVFLPEEVVRDYLLADGDVLISRSGTIGRSFLYDSRTHGPCAYAGYLVRFVPDSGILPRYVFLFTKTQSFAGFLRVMAISSTIENVNAEKYANAALPLPPLPEQAAIVRFLDHVDRRIRRYIRAKQKLIKLLEEQKQAIIHRAVTRGLDPNVRLKPSGVEYLGEIPEHWEVAPLKKIAWFKSGAGFPVSEQGEQNSEVPFIKVSDMTMPGNEIWIECANSTVSKETAVRLGAFVFPEKTIVFPKVGGALLTNKRRLLRKPSCIDNNVMGCVIKGIELQYAFILLQQLDLGRLAKPGPVPAIGEGDVREIKVALPPSKEQIALVVSVRAATDKLVHAIAVAQREISLLREYRTRMFADVVTGKLDVRETVARLPDESDEPEPSDGADVLSDTDKLPENEAITVGLGETEQ